MISLPSHLSQGDLLALAVADEQQEAADQELLLQGEALSFACARGRHAVAVHLRQHPRNLGNAHPRHWNTTRDKKGGGTVIIHQ